MFTIFETPEDGDKPASQGMVRTDMQDLLEGNIERKVEEAIADGELLRAAHEAGELPECGYIHSDGTVQDGSGATVGYNRKFAKGWEAVFGRRDN